MDNKTKVTANINKNRLYITFPNRITENILNKAYTDIRFCVSDLREGFDVIADYSKCKVIHIGGIYSLLKIINFLASKKIGEVVRILDKKNISFHQWLNFSNNNNCYKAIIASNTDEAEKKLEIIKKREGIRFNIKDAIVMYQYRDNFFNETVCDISISGCSIFKENSNFIKGELIELKLIFYKELKNETIFQLKSEIVRYDTTKFAVKFLNNDNDIMNNLYQAVSESIMKTNNCK